MSETPFLKWPGGKRWAASRLTAIIREALLPNGRYFEPFLGGGAVLFHLRPDRSIVGDINAELIATYQTVRSHPEALVQKLRKWPVNAETYYRIRSSQPRTEIGRAARFLYLNRTAFGGVYRVNYKGEFNVPFGGRSHSILWKRELLVRAASVLEHCTILNADFAELLKQSKRGDVVYCDPTYTVAHDNNGFIRYNERNFSWLDQLRLASEAAKAAKRGATVLVSNAHHHSLVALYPSAEILELERFSRISRSVTGRGRAREFLFILRPQKNVRRVSRR